MHNQITLNKLFLAIRNHPADFLSLAWLLILAIYLPDALLLFGRVYELLEAQYPDVNIYILYSIWLFVFFLPAIFGRSLILFSTPDKLLTTFFTEEKINSHKILIVAKGMLKGVYILLSLITGAILLAISFSMFPEEEFVQNQIQLIFASNDQEKLFSPELSTHIGATFYLLSTFPTFFAMTIVKFAGLLFAFFAAMPIISTTLIAGNGMLTYFLQKKSRDSLDQ